MAQVKSFSDIVLKIEQLLYASPTMELDFSPTFEVDKESWDCIQNSMDELSGQAIPKIPYEQKEAYLKFNYMGVTCIVKAIDQPYKNSEIVNIID